MAIQDEAPANAAYTNSKLMSRTQDTSTVGKVDFQNTTESTDKDTGSIITEGGVGVEKNINAGGNIAAVGTVLGSNLSGTNTGDVTLGAAGSTPNANGASLVGQVLTLQPADGTNSGLLSTAAQLIAGVKSFIAQAIFNAGLAIKDTGSAFKVNISAPSLAADYTITLPVDDGTPNQVLETDGAGNLSWVTPAAAASPLTTKGDIFTYDTADERLPVGTDGQILSADSAEATGLKWIAAPSGSSPLTTKGDLFTRNATVDDRLAVGTNGYLLAADSAEATGLKWVPSGGAGANTALSNLTTTAINDDLIFGADGAPNDSFIKTADSTTAAEVSGALVLKTGDQTFSSGTDVSGALSLKTGDVPSGYSGEIIISTGVSAATGNISISTPNGGLNGGNISITAGQGSTGTGGNINLAAGQSSATPGEINLMAGAGANAVNGGDVNIETAPLTDYAITGNINLKTGIDGYNGTGQIKLETGSTAITGTGDIHLLTGDSIETTEATGNIILETGPSSIPATYQGDVLALSRYFRFPKHSAAPNSPTSGDSYYNTTTNKLMVYDGTTWQACW